MYIQYVPIMSLFTPEYLPVKFQSLKRNLIVITSLRSKSIIYYLNPIIFFDILKEDTFIKNFCVDKLKSKKNLTDCNIYRHS